MPPSRRNERLGAAIVSARKARGLSQKALADRLGVSQPTVLRWEKGTEPSPEFFPGIASELGIDLGKFIPRVAIASVAATHALEAFSPADVAEAGMVFLFRSLPNKAKRIVLGLLEGLTMRWRSPKLVKRSAMEVLEYAAWMESCLATGELEPPPEDEGSSWDPNSALLGPSGWVGVDEVASILGMPPTRLVQALQRLPEVRREAHTEAAMAVRHRRPKQKQPK